jgi:hypothetical protein
VSTSPNIRAALDEIKRLRDEFREIRLNYYVKAETATNGRILGRRGIRAKVDPQELLTRNTVSIRAYGSPELLEWIAENPRMTFAQYEEQMFDRGHELYVEPEEDLYPYDAYDSEPDEDDDEHEEHVRAHQEYEKLLSQLDPERLVGRVLEVQVYCGSPSPWVLWPDCQMRAGHEGEIHRANGRAWEHESSRA